MTMGHFIADMAYLLLVLFYLMAFVLLVEWLFHLLPGAWLNSVRRLLFRISFPMLKMGEACFPLRIGAVDLTALLMALTLLAICRYGIPWLILWGFSIRG